LDINKTIDDGIKLITLTDQSLSNATEICTKFLVTVAVLSTYRKSCEREKTKLQTLVDAVYQEIMNTKEGKTITEKKTKVLADKGYAEYREALENCESEITWVKKHIDIFENAHLTYRQMARD